MPYACWLLMTRSLFYYTHHAVCMHKVLIAAYMVVHSATCGTIAFLFFIAYGDLAGVSLCCPSGLSSQQERIPYEFMVFTGWVVPIPDHQIYVHMYVLPNH